MQNFLAFAVLAIAIFANLGIHQIPEGHLGIYFRGGAILDGYEEPGWHVMAPFVTTVENVQVTL